MSKKFKNWLDKPITRRDYLKWCAVALGVSALEYAALLGWWYRDKVKDITTEAWNKLTRKEELSKDVEIDD